MNKKNVLFIFLLVMLLIIPVIVNAESLAGSLGGSGYNQTRFSTPGSYGQGTLAMDYLVINDIQYLGGLFSIIRFDNGSLPQAFLGVARGSSTVSGIAVPFRCNTTTPTTDREVARGWGGFQRYWDNAFPTPNELNGYQWMQFDSFNVSGLTGDIPLQCYHASNNTVFGIVTYTGYQYIEPPPSGGFIAWRGATVYNDWLVTKSSSAESFYTVNKSGAWITGNITKTGSSKIYIYNGLTGAGLTSENTVGTSPFNFTVPSDTIIIGMEDSYLNHYNTSVLFTSSLPTPTPTPTVTYPPNMQYYNATFIIKNANNSTAISNVYVDFEINSNENRQGYTNSSGMITFDEIKVASNQVLRITKSGYLPNVFTYSQPVYGNSIRTEYMYPDVGGNPITPTNINITVQVKDSNGNQPINQAYVTIRDTIAGTPEQGAYTNSSGYVVFQHFPNTAYIDGIISKSGYTQYNWHPDYAGIQTGDITVLRYLLGTAQPTPTLPSYDTWTLTANPASILLGNSAVLTADCSNSTKESYPTLQTVLYYDNNNLGAYSSPVLIGTYHYNTSSSRWNYKDKNGVWNYSYASYNPLSLYVTPDTSGTHTYSVYTFGAGNYPYTTSTDLGTAQTEVVVTGAGAGGSLTMNLFAIDGATTSHLQDYGLVLTNTITGQSNIYNVSYDVNVNLPRGAQMRLEGDKEGYNHGSIDFTVPTDINIVAGTFGAMKGVNLFPYGSYIAGNVTVTVHVDDAETYYPLSNVAVYMTGSLAPKYTGTQGESVSFIMPENYPFTVRAVKDGYCSVSDAKNTSQASNGYLYVPLFMKFGNCAGGITPTHTPIGNVTPTPTPYYGGQSNATAGSCSGLNWTSNASWFDKLRSSLACNGVPDLLTQNLIIAVGLILLIAAIGAKYAKGIGFAVGSILGAVIAMGLGLIPFWIIAVLVIACIAIILSKTILTSGG